MKVSEVMVRDPVKVSPDAQCGHLARLMRDRGIGSVVVVEDGRPVGIVTERDLVHRVMAASMNPDECTAAQVCSRPVVAVSVHADVEMAIRAMKVGALDFLQKPFNDQELLDLVQKAIEQSVAATHGRAQQAELQQLLDLLTPRQRQVLDRVVVGKVNKVIAAELGLSKKTVEIHRASMMKKMRVKSLPELVNLIAELGSTKDKPLTY